MTALAIALGAITGVVFTNYAPLLFPYVKPGTLVSFQWDGCDVMTGRYVRRHFPWFHTIKVEMGDSWDGRTVTVSTSDIERAPQS